MYLGLDIVIEIVDFLFLWVGFELIVEILLFLKYVFCNMK